MSPFSTILRLLFALAGALDLGSQDPNLPLSPAAQALVDRAFADLPEGAPVVDVHAHLLGMGRDGSGIWVNPRRFSPSHPGLWLQTRLYLGAAKIADRAHFDSAYEARLVRLARQFGRPVRIHLLAMDHAYRADGSIDLERTEFYVPNDYVVAVCARHPELFVPVVSVHPARPDALPELERWAARGVRWVKWLPNAQAIDPAEARCVPFYRRMQELGMTLLTHVGEERAVAVKGAQELGNPLRFRRALDLGLRVVMAHCASLGRSADLDHPGRRTANFDLFLRLMDEPRYRGLLFGDISALTQVNRMPGPLLEVLRRPDLQARLVQGSDDPLPGVGPLVWTRKMAAAGMVTTAERGALDELQRANPLLFDLVLKRTLRDPSTGRGLSLDIFLGTALTAPRAAPAPAPSGSGPGRP